MVGVANEEQMESKMDDDDDDDDDDNEIIEITMRVIMR